MEIALVARAICPHCDTPMVLRYFSGSMNMLYLCVDGCKAEFEAFVQIGKTLVTPVCGAKRVQTND